MDDFRSRSNGDGRMELEAYGSRVAPSSSSSSSAPHGFRCYSTSYVSNHAPHKEMKLKKGTNTSVSSSSSSSSKSGWILSDPEIQRKKRVAGYKAFALEGKMKGSFRKSFRWIKDRCSQVVHGSWHGSGPVQTVQPYKGPKFRAPK